MVGLVLKRSFDVRMYLRYLAWEYHRKYQREYVILLKKKNVCHYEKRICTGIVIFKYEESCINKTVFLQKYQYVLIFYVFLFYYTTIYIYI